MATSRQDRARARRRGFTPVSYPVRRVRPGVIHRGRLPTWLSTSGSPVSATTPSSTSPPGTSSARSTPPWSPATPPTPCSCSSTRRCSPPASAPTPHERPVDPGGAPVIDVDRGGKITFHGPGQLVGYPIVALPDHVKVVDYVRRVEEALIAVCADFGVTTARVPGRSGVWLRADDRGPERKVAALGIRVSRGVTMHGFALNCDVDLGWYDRFVPCGIADAGVTSLSQELGRDVTVADVIPQRRAAPRRTYLAWAPYTPTPDYEPRPEPGRAPRIELVTP